MSDANHTGHQRQGKTPSKWRFSKWLEGVEGVLGQHEISLLKSDFRNILRSSKRNLIFILTSLVVRIILPLNNSIKVSDGLGESPLCKKFTGLVAEFSAKEGFEVLVQVD